MSVQSHWTKVQLGMHGSLSDPSPTCSWLRLSGCPLLMHDALSPSGAREEEGTMLEESVLHESGEGRASEMHREGDETQADKSPRPATDVSTSLRVPSHAPPPGAPVAGP
jgi:hypothetical protein